MRRLLFALALFALLALGCSALVGGFEGNAAPVTVGEPEPEPEPEPTSCPDACAAAGFRCDIFDFDRCLSLCDAPDGGAPVGLVDCLEAEGASCQEARACLRPPANPPFKAAPWGTAVRDVAGPFTLDTSDGPWDFETEWTGRDSYLFVAWAPGSATAGVFSSPLRPLLMQSPPDVHYVFGWLSDQPGFEAARARWQTELDTLPEPQRTHWRERVHFVMPALTSGAGWVSDMLKARRANPPMYLGNELTSFAIDREQRLREVGMLGRLGANGVQADLSMLRHEALAFDFEATRQARLDTDGARVITLAQHVTAHDTIDVDVDWPGEAELAAFDTLEVDLSLECPQHRSAECGAWDYLSHLRRCDGATAADGGVEWDCGDELARWITPYWREGRWVTDISRRLPALKPGVNHLRWTANGQWDPRTTDYLVSLSLRLSNRGRGLRPTDAIPLWRGGTLDAAYDAAHPDRVVPIPADARRVELVTLLTGHGGNPPYNCNEFCDHQHRFTVDGVEHLQSFPEVRASAGCEARVGEGVVPNQHGTWYYGRGGWCPGLDVAPWVVDVTSEVTPGDDATLRYRATFADAPVTQLLGEVELSSWLVIWR